MAVTYYVNTAAANDSGDGSSGNPWKYLQPHLATLPAGENVTIYCTGGTESIPAGKYIETNGNSAASVKIVGNWSGFDLAESCYKIHFTGGAWDGIAANRSGATLRLENVLIENSRTVAAASNYGFITSGNGSLQLINCGVIYNIVTSNSSYVFCVNINNTTGSTTISNCTFYSDLVVSSPPNSNSRLVRCASNSTNVSINNCIFHPGSNSWTFIVAGVDSNVAPPDFTNCVIAGRQSGGAYSNCVYAVGPQNTLDGGGNTLVVLAVMNNWYVNTAAKNFTPTDLNSGAAHTQLVGKGKNYTAQSGSSLDVKGNDRNATAAGAAWDIGPYEWGFGAPYPDVHSVTDVSQIADPECIYYGQSPAIVVGNQVSYKNTTETNGWPVSIDAQGFPIIDTGGATGTDSFKFNIGRSGVWDPVPPASNTWTFTISPPGPPVLLTVNNGNPIQAGQMNVPYTGTGFGASTATRTVWLTQGSVEVVQTQVTGNDTGGTFNVVGYETGGRLKYGQAEIKVTVP